MYSHLLDWGLAQTQSRYLKQMCLVPSVVVVKRVNGMEFAVNKMGRAW